MHRNKWLMVKLNFCFRLLAWQSKCSWLVKINLSRSNADLELRHIGFHSSVQIMSARSTRTDKHKRHRRRSLSRALPKPIVRKSIITRTSACGTAQKEGVPRRLVTEGDFKQKKIEALRADHLAQMKVCIAATVAAGVAQLPTCAFFIERPVWDRAFNY